ncbi:MAG: chemotaxis protein [Thaumarchaeota archaeon]|nr:MAG: chemotaxis protein [Nitrososphaerota archaeon]TLX94944.1 MAG: chemotaxis protein [Nitrososphaerota archaeon]
MVKKQKNNTKSSPISKGTLIGMAIIAAAAIGGGAYLWNSSVPVNMNTPVFATPSNIYIKAIHTDQGYAFDEQSTRTGKRTLSGTNIDPSIHIPKGTLVSLHVINEDKDTGSEQDLNIDSFNVHTRHLKYFGAQTINFVADKDGSYTYYSSIHPEMKGTIVVDP